MVQLACTGKIIPCPKGAELHCVHCEMKDIHVCIWRKKRATKKSHNIKKSMHFFSLKHSSCDKTMFPLATFFKLWAALKNLCASVYGTEPSLLGTERLSCSSLHGFMTYFRYEIMHLAVSSYVCLQSATVA